MNRRIWLTLALGLSWILSGDAGAQAQDTIARVKSSILAVGTWQKTRAPAFQFRGTGFVVGDGSLLATNAHVLPTVLGEGADPERLMVALPGAEPGSVQLREASRVAVNADSDLALLRLSGAALPALKLAPADSAREGDRLLFTGYPIGAALGVFPATHQAMIASLTPIAIPSANSRSLDARQIRRLQSGAFGVYQLDGTAYPGNSGSPLYDPATGEVVGIINMVSIKGSKESALSQPSGISYAIPVRHLRELINNAR